MKSHLQIGSELFRSALEQTPASIVITDTDGKIIYVNKFFTNLTGYTLDEVLDKNPRILKSGFQSDGFYEKLWSTISSGKTWEGDLLNKKKDGTLFWEKATIKPILNEQGEITNYIAVKQDITEEIERLESSERRERILNSVEKLSNTGGWVYDVKENEFFWSDELYRIHGFENKEIENKAERSLKCYHPDDQNRVEQAFNKCLHEAKDYDLTVRFKDQKGNKKWVRTKSRAVKDHADKVCRIIGSVRDVTEEVEQENEIRQSRERFRALVNSFDDFVFTLDRKGRYTALYGHWSDSLGKDSFLGKSALEIFGKEKGKVHLEAVEQVLEDEKSVSYEWDILNQDGEEEYYHTHLSLLRYDDKKEVLGVSRNITSEVNYREEINRTYERLDFALEAMKAGTWDWDLKSDELIVNEWWAKMLGYRLNELKPHIDTWKDLTHPEDLKSTINLLDKLRYGESPYFETRIRMQHKDGHWVWINDRGKIVDRDNEGNPTRLAGTHIDISDKVYAEKALQLSEKKYRDLFERSSDPSLLFRGETIVDCNRAAVNFLGYEKKSELIGKTPIEISPEKQPDGVSSVKLLEKNIETLKSKKSLRFEWMHQKKMVHQYR